MPFQVLVKEQGALFLPSFPSSTLTNANPAAGLWGAAVWTGDWSHLWVWLKATGGKRQTRGWSELPWAASFTPRYTCSKPERNASVKEGSVPTRFPPRWNAWLCYYSWRIICVALVSCSARCFYSEVKLLFLLGNRNDQPTRAGPRNIINWVKLLLPTAMLVDLLGEINFSKCGQTKGLMKKNDGMISRVTGFPVSNSIHVWGMKGKKGFRRWWQVKKRILLLLLNHKNLLNETI